MSGIPPTGGPSRPTPPEEPVHKLAHDLSKAIGELVEQTYHILQSPHLADDHNTLEKYANCVTNLHHLSQETGG